ncbi:MAG TPA: hypothetical protein VG272_05905 [Candidatus Acidoferrales bacterium]|jgi:hypothetical protein|nr:hypothetical protein [Candidatus Acidoferrales bacterium]
MKTRKTIWIATLIAIMSVLPGVARAGSVGSDILTMFPKESGELAYANLKEARAFPWFNQLKEQMLPAKFREFETFLSSAGIDPNTQVTELAWALVPSKSSTDNAAGAVPTMDQIVGVALGQFNPASAEAYFTSKKLPIVKVRTFSLFAFGGGSGPNDLFFFFIDSNTAAFGQRQQLEKMIGIRYGEGQGLYANTDFSALVDQANGSGTVWAVLSPAYTRLAMRQLVPETAQFPAAAQLTSKLKAMTISIKGSSGVDAKFEAVCGSTDDANTFAALLTAGLMYRKYQVGNSNPELGALLDSAQVTPAGDRLDVKLSLTDDQMQSLIKRNTFVVSM